MFNGFLKKDDTIYFKFGRELVECPNKYNKLLIGQLEQHPKKVTNLFSSILNEKMVMQDIIDSNMDQDITWQFIKSAIAISGLVKEK